MTHLNFAMYITIGDGVPALVSGCCDCMLYHCAGEWIEWCGFLVNTSTLDVKINLSRYTSTGIDDIGDHTDTVNSTMS